MNPAPLLYNDTQTTFNFAYWEVNLRSCCSAYWGVNPAPLLYNDTQTTFNFAYWEVNLRSCCSAYWGVNPAPLLYNDTQTTFNFAYWEVKLRSCCSAYWGGEPSPTSLHLPLENPKKQRHFVTADLSEATSKQCCPRNSAILLRSFLSKCAQKTAPFCYGRFAGSNLTSNAVRETAPFCYDRFFPVHVPKKQRHFVTADLWEATSQAMLLCS